MKCFKSIVAVLAGLVAVPLEAHPASTTPNDTTQNVVVVLAHPDDELVISPALARLVREGAKVRVIFATDGDQGPGVSGMETGAGLAEMRRAEARCSILALGAQAMVALELGDGTLGIGARKPDSAAKQLHERLGEFLGEAATVITWGPDGGYGHSDHRMVSAVVTQLVQAIPAEKRPRLLYPALINAPLPEPLASQGWATTAPDLATVRYRYSAADLAAADKAAQCHTTQFDEATRAMIVPGFHQAVWKGEVSFRPAF